MYKEDFFAAFEWLDIDDEGRIPVAHVRHLLHNVYKGNFNAEDVTHFTE